VSVCGRVLCVKSLGNPHEMENFTQPPPFMQEVSMLFLIKSYIHE